MYTPEVNAIISEVVKGINKLNSMVQSDTLNPYEYWKIVKDINEHTTIMLDEAQPKAVSFLSGKPADYLATIKVEVRKGYAQWDFSKVTYKPYLSANTDLLKAKTAVKDQEEFLKSLVKQQQKVMPNAVSLFENAGALDLEKQEEPMPTEYIDQETGEVYSLPTIKSYTRDSIVSKK